MALSHLSVTYSCPFSSCTAAVCAVAEAFSDTSSPSCVTQLLLENLLSSLTAKGRRGKEIIF
jgi:hypothetical protein